MLQLTQSCEFINADEVIDRAIHAWTLLQNKLELIASPSPFIRRETIPSQDLLRILRSLIEDNRIDIEQSYEDGCSVQICLLHHPSAVLPLISPNLSRPFRTLDARERLRVFQERVFWTRVTPSLFASTFPTTEAFASTFRESDGENVLHLIVECMATEIGMRLSKSKTEGSTRLSLL